MLGSLYRVVGKVVVRSIVALLAMEAFIRIRDKVQERFGGKNPE